MADKTSTLVLTVNLSCCRCYMKIKKTLSKFEEIQCQIFDEKQNKVTISGQFDPEKLEMKLWYKARNCITGCEIKIQKEPADDPKPTPSPEDTPKPPPANPPPSLAITVNVNVIGIPFLPYVPKVGQSQRPYYEVICEDGIFRLPSVPISKRCCGGCEEDKICSCSGYGSGSICSSPSFW